MKKQFTKIVNAAGNLSRSSKTDQKDFELETIEKQVDKYRDVLEKMVRKLPAVSSATDLQERDKRIKKNSHYKIGQSLHESSKELSKDMPLHHALVNCGDLEKSLAECIVDSELETETEVVRRFKLILDTEIQDISTLKRNVSRSLQEYASLKRSYESAQRSEESQTKISHLKDQMEQCEVKLDRERDAWAAKMFELIAKEDEIVQCIRDYVLNQRNYHERALSHINSSLSNIQDIIQSTVKSRFGTSLKEQLSSTNREISYVLELCICCLIEHGLCEEGILRVGCASTKLRRMKRALEAQHVKTPLPVEYQDPHVIGSILKLYLRELPEPLLTYKHHKDFIHAAERHTEAERKAEIKATLNKLPAENYANLRYLTKFLSLVTQQVEVNKMNSQNVAIVMSPNMLWPREDKNNPADYLGQVNCSSAVNIIVELLISQWDYFFDGDVDFFITLQRHKLFVDGKSKSNSSTENLDKHDGDTAESPRYGTIRRQKACAPSPPGKPLNNTSTTPHTIDANSNNCEIQVHRNGDIKYRPGVKDLFPQTMNNSTDKGEKPEKPPLPKVLQLQQQTQHHEQSQQQQPHPQQQQQQQQQEQPVAVTPKPVPMTRTQFFGLDNLPSPVADRRSSDSANSLTFKPDLPQKPKIPKRPMVLGLHGTNKSDDEGTITPTNDAGGGGGGGTASDGYVRHTTEKFIEKLRQDNCDNMINATVGTTLKDNSHDNHGMVVQQTELNANITSNANSTAHTNTTNVTATTAASAPTIATTASGSDRSTTAVSQQHSTESTAHEKRTTPTTPISPHTMLTPKRPTVPAPPPPIIVKKQAE